MDHFILDSTPELYKSEHKPIKIYPKAEKHSYLTMNERVYDFINQRSWNSQPTIATKPESIKQNQKPHNWKRKCNKDTANCNISNPPNKTNISGKTINYKNHKIYITDSLKDNPDTNITHNFEVQLGAFNSREKAKLEKIRITKLFPTIVKNYNFNIEKAYLETKGLIYRLKMGPFNDTADAKNFCNNLRKKGTGCFLKINKT